jgi:putative transposase
VAWRRRPRTGDLEQATKGGKYALHSQSVQALCQKFAANLATATELRRQELAETGRIQTAYPHPPKAYQTVVWKDQAFTVLTSGELRLPTGAQRPPVLLPLPAEYRGANLRRVELTWRADHYDLCLTLDTGATQARHRRDTGATQARPCRPHCLRAKSPGWT